MLISNRFRNGRRISLADAERRSSGNVNLVLQLRKIRSTRGFHVGFSAKSGESLVLWIAWLESLDRNKVKHAWSAESLAALYAVRLHDEVCHGAVQHRTEVVCLFPRID